MGRQKPIRFIVFPLPVVVSVKAIEAVALPNSFLHLTFTTARVSCLFSGTWLTCRLLLARLTKCITAARKVPNSPGKESLPQLRKMLNQSDEPHLNQRAVIAQLMPFTTKYKRKATHSAPLRIPFEVRELFQPCSPF